MASRPAYGWRARGSVTNSHGTVYTTGLRPCMHVQTASAERRTAPAGGNMPRKLTPTGKLRRRIKELEILLVSGKMRFDNGFDTVRLGVAGPDKVGWVRQARTAGSGRAGW